jgi:hypothetical protein
MVLTIGNPGNGVYKFYGAAKIGEIEFTFYEFCLRIKPPFVVDLVEQGAGDTRADGFGAFFNRRTAA